MRADEEKKINNLFFNYLKIYYIKDKCKIISQNGGRLINDL